MRKLTKLIFPAIIVILATVVLHVFSDDHEGPAFVSSTTGERGASLLYDTLRHMGYPARVSRRPLSAFTDINNAYILIQPNEVHFSQTKAEEMLAWVNSGGRLIFLHNNPFTIVDTLIDSRGTRFGSLMIHELGQGMLIRGFANDVINENMMDNADTGARIHAILSNWGADRIIFAEYYHGMQTTDTFFNQLPIIARLVLVQLGLLAIIIVWHLGKRFGNPIAYYEEQEREENEHVHALTRLYLKTRRRD
ncbi:MAG: DUF4350 domain-containing protein [Firmicutes bacterium]|nr:DUF4350 domain-containing protein [Bacillota bacterium]